MYVQIWHPDVVDTNVSAVPLLYSYCCVHLCPLPVLEAIFIERGVA